MQRVISVFLPTWPTDLLRKDPHLVLPPGLPLVTASRDGNKHIVTSVDAKAMSFGIRQGHTIAHARVLAAGLEVINANIKGDEERLRQLSLACLKRFTPLTSHNPPDGVWLDITGCAHLFGSEGALLQKLVAMIAPVSENVRVAVADTFGAAHAIARYGGESFTIIKPGEHKAAIAQLPISALRIEEKTVNGLRKVGFDTIAQLYETSRAPLATRFGALLLFRLDQALGSYPEPIEPLATPEIPQLSKVFLEPVTNPEYLKKAIEVLLDELCKKLAEGGKGVRQIDCVVSRVDNYIKGIRVGTSKASCDARHIFRLLCEHLEKLDAGFGIETLTLRVSLCEPLPMKQIAASFGKAPEADLAGLIDVLRNRLGHDHLFKIQPVESDVPDRSIRRVSPEVSIQPIAGIDDLPRPCRLLTPPEPIQALALLPDNPPKNFTWRDRRYNIKRADGPERIFGEWWRNQGEMAAVRDYYRVEDENGARYWVYRSGDGIDPATGSYKWFLHGVFG